MAAKTFLSITTSVNEAEATKVMRTLTGLERWGTVVVALRKYRYISKKSSGDVLNIITAGSRARKIPARPFLTYTISKHFERYRSYARRRVGKIQNANQAKQVLKEIGNKVVQDIQLEMNRGPWIRNAEYTLKRKAPEVRPLFHTGKMYRSWMVSIKMHSEPKVTKMKQAAAEYYKALRRGK